MVKIEDVRSELQLPEAVISDIDIQYAITKVGKNDMNLVCAEVLSMFLRKNRGRVKLKLKNYEEWIDPKEVRKDIRVYLARSQNAKFDDNFTYPDSVFEETQIDTQN